MRFMGALSLIKDGNTYATTHFAISATIALQSGDYWRIIYIWAKQNRTGVPEFGVYLVVRVGSRHC